MDDIAGRWKSFSMTEEEVVFGVSDEVMKKGKRVVKWGLLGKLLVSKLLNKKIFQSTISSRVCLLMKLLGMFFCSPSVTRVRGRWSWSLNLGFLTRDCGSRGAAAGIAEEDLPYGHWLRVDSKRKLTSGVGNLSRVSAGRTGSEEYFVAVNATDLQINEQLALTSKALKSANDHVPMHVAPYSYAARLCSWKINASSDLSSPPGDTAETCFQFSAGLEGPRKEGPDGLVLGDDKNKWMVLGDRTNLEILAEAGSHES
ncbi:hypothetical protein TIFTF001_033332 [Ficus carica]|uniref:Uncharacterized protein n=1 Tax=Ficus carica TaxID=3494 RepID=A0AA88J3L2_FICCA|nr:hypothetical protein TIFTF001_033332 [Ficus carica]